jgi:hypothetical protein
MRWTVVLAVAALFLGGFLGGLIGTMWHADGPPADRVPTAGATPLAARPASEVRDGELTVALADLTREVQRLREALDARPAGVARTSVGAGADAPAEVTERLLAALESLDRSLSSGRRPGSGAGTQAAPLVLPSGNPRHDLIAELRAIKDDEARSRRHRFLTYQQALDRFGVPDQVYSGGRWIYEDPVTQRETQFTFEDGLLIRID